VDAVYQATAAGLLRAMEPQGCRHRESWHAPRLKR